MEGQPGQTVVAHGVTTQQKTRDLIPLQGEHILADATLQHLERKAQLAGLFIYLFSRLNQGEPGSDAGG